MARQLAVLLIAVLAASSAEARARVSFEPPQGHWTTTEQPDGTTLFTLQTKRARATIALHAAEPSPEGAASFAQQLSAAPSPEFVDRGQVQTFTSPDGRAVVAVDGKANNDARSPGRQCWIFQNSQRVLAQFVATDAAEFKREEAAFMGLVASVKIQPEAGAAVAAPSPSPSPTAAPHADTVDATLTFDVPSGWKRLDQTGATWLRAPKSSDGSVTYVLLTPAERLDGPFAVWYERRLQPGQGMRILSRGAMARQQVSTGYDLIRQKLTVEVRGQERHEQDVLAAHRGGAAVLVALDSTSAAGLAAHEAAFKKFLAGLDIRPELTGVAAAPVASSAPLASGPMGYPSLTLPSGWHLRDGGPDWRTYVAPDNTAQAYVVMLVSQITASVDPVKSVTGMRKSLGLESYKEPESSPLGHGERLLSLIDSAPAGQLSTETALLVGNGKQVIFILRSNSPQLFDAQRPAFEAALGSVGL